MMFTPDISNTSAYAFDDEPGHSLIQSPFRRTIQRLYPPRKQNKKYQQIS
ncbi:hypothetical [Yersinia pestis KIM10+]|uniref:Uncharacterized protein n=1 Tax=Yersinia pestis TaxID=632 RepID=Q8CL40_YERPE|nr:hypothetical [Yersinia pestis KIM10+]